VVQHCSLRRQWAWRPRWHRSWRSRRQYPRDYLRAPGYRDIDLGVFRDIHFERFVFQIRGEATNAFNMVSLNAPGSSGPPPTVGAKPSSSTFGVITAAASPRLIQVGARLTF
jgi:hypothetical protein